MQLNLPLRSVEMRLRRKRESHAGQLASAKGLAATFQTMTDGDLKSIAASIRDKLETPREKRGAIAQALALFAETLHRTRGVHLYDVQLTAGLAVNAGKVAEMQTGEGKTFSVACAAMLAALQGKCVHIATPNAYLAERDYRQMKPAFEMLGLSTALLPQQTCSVMERSRAYDHEIVYGTGYDFGFDFLRDQAVKRSVTSPPFETAMLARLRSRERFEGTKIQKQRHMAIIDEIDQVLIDDAGSPLILSDTEPGEAVDTQACQLANRLATQLVPDEHFQLTGNQGAHLTPSGSIHIHATSLNIPFQQLLRPWSEYVEQALKAHYILKRQVHYLVAEERIRIVDSNTGRVFSDRTWSDGLQQAVEAKENIKISGLKSVIAQITRQRFFRMYDQLAGVTGTALGCEREFSQVYDMQVQAIPRRMACRRRVYPLQVFADSECKWAAIADEVRKVHATTRPILIGTRTIADSEIAASMMHEQGLPFRLLNGLQDAEEAEIIATAGRPSAITIATNMAGRGTDIALDETARSCGGLHVVVTEPNNLHRVDRQLVGRCARQGDPGSARVFASADDSIFKNHGSWLVNPIRRSCTRNGNLPIDFTRRLRRLQDAIARQQFASRLALMRSDLARENIFASGIRDS